MNEWNIQSRAHACQACTRPFVDKEAYHTVLCDDKHELIRLDVCLDCWREKYSQDMQERKGFISHWKGVYEAPQAAPPEAIKRETAETLLRKLIELNEPKYQAAAYILSAMLERKRLLRVKEQLKRDGQRIFIYEHPKTGDIFTIVDPNLQLDQLQQVQHDVGELMEKGLPEDQVAPAPAPVEPTTPAPDGLPPETPPADAPALEAAPGSEEAPTTETAVIGDEVTAAVAPEIMPEPEQMVEPLADEAMQAEPVPEGTPETQKPQQTTENQAH